MRGFLLLALFTLGCGAYVPRFSTTTRKTYAPSVRLARQAMEGDLDALRAAGGLVIGRIHDTGTHGVQASAANNGGTHIVRGGYSKDGQTCRKNVFGNRTCRDDYSQDPWEVWHVPQAAWCKLPEELVPRSPIKRVPCGS